MRLTSSMCLYFNQIYLDPGIARTKMIKVSKFMEIGVVLEAVPKIWKYILF